MRAGELSVEAVLGRAVLDVGGGRFGEYLAGASVLVTGAGGSVGVELSARVARLGAQELVLVDQAEAPLLGLVRTLRHELGFARVEPVLADIKSRTRMVDLFERRRPDVVFHAAAYKHVSLLESCPVEGAATNILGTRFVVDGARRAGVGRFVAFSTDKAVRPTSVLGRTKAVAEWIVAAGGGDGAQGRFASVRLGNVVDSAGSFLPVFRRQVATGGPLTVTHPEATRFLMTAGEAAGLAIVAGGLADSSSVFWLDSGPPVCVLDVARRLAAAGPPDVGIDFVGLGAGERLHEQLFTSRDEILSTPCEHVSRTTVPDVDPDWLDGRLAALARHVEHASAAGVRAALAELLAEREAERAATGVAAR